VNAANSGDTVYLCGTVVGSIFVTKSLTLTGANGATLRAPSTWTDIPLAQLPPPFASDNLVRPQAIIMVWGANANVAISNLKVQGPLPGNGGCAVQLFGVLVISGGSVTMANDQVLNATYVDPSLMGCQSGLGVLIGRTYWPDQSFNFPQENFVGHATISGTTVSGYAKNGITVDGSGSTADLRGNTVTGAGRVNTVAQNGIQMSRGADGQIRDNTVTGNAYTGTGNATSTGIVLFGGCGDALVTGVQVMGNTLVNDDIGIQLDNETDACDLTPPSAMTNIKVVNNTLSNDAFTNLYPYQAGISDVGNNDKIINNTISGAGYALTIDATAPYAAHVKVHANK
jgi:hypothetical protein